jgi:phage terminase small subunit
MARGKAKNLGAPLAGLLPDDDLGPGNWSDRQRKFVHCYLRHGNGARAVREAGYSGKPENADRIAWKLRNDPRFAHVREAIDRREAEMQARLKVGAERVLEELSKVAFFSLADVLVIQEDGTASLDLTEADAAHLAALGEIQIEERTIKGQDGEPDAVARTIKVKAHSKLDALEKLGKNLKLFTDKLEMSGGLDIASRLTAARRRAKLSQDDANEHESTGDAVDDACRVR